MPPNKRGMRPEVSAAVHDIMYGETLDSGTEWLQREYLRLMKREAQLAANESKYKEVLSKGTSTHHDGRHVPDEASTHQQYGAQ